MNWTGPLTIQRFIAKYVHLIEGGGRGKVTGRGPQKFCGMISMGLLRAHLREDKRGVFFGGGSVPRRIVLRA